MTAAHIPAGAFPDWAKEHRTLRQVARTESLLMLARAGAGMPPSIWSELAALITKADRHNPPADETERRA